MLYLEIAIVVVLICVNGLLSMSELAIVSSRPARLKAMIDRLTAQKGTDEYHVYEIYQNATPDRAQGVAGGMQKMIE